MATPNRIYVANSILDQIVIEKAYRREALLHCRVGKALRLPRCRRISMQAAWPTFGQIANVSCHVFAPGPQRIDRQELAKP